MFFLNEDKQCQSKSKVRSVVVSSKHGWVFDSEFKFDTWVYFVLIVYTMYFRSEIEWSMIMNHFH